MWPHGAWRAVRGPHRECGEMGKLGHGPAEGLVDGHLFGRVGDMVIAANDVGDAHQASSTVTT